VSPAPNVKSLAVSAARDDKQLQPAGKFIRQPTRLPYNKRKMRTFGAFSAKGGKPFYGELIGDDEVSVLERPFWVSIEPTGEKIDRRDLEIRVPVSPSKLIAVGLNYAEHIAEMKRTPLGTPLIWFKAPTSLLAHKQDIEIAFPEHQTDFETELAVVIGARAKNVSVEQARDFIFGYSVGEDISDRDLQKSEKQFGRCKSFDTYTPIGPFVYSNVDVADLEITLRQNGDVKQRARTSQMIYSVADIVSFASQNLTLLPGDVILTGTPSGVDPIRAGDELEARIGDWPALLNRVGNAGS
jgi:2-keto-4-pentenoate hydratase/2-oxohepta-3-ene-1,7-dioic acid hydratase in catechol pathway